MIVIKINNVLATRSSAKYLGRRPHRATLILSNLIDPIKTLFRGRSITARLESLKRDLNMRFNYRVYILNN